MRKLSIAVLLLGMALSACRATSPAPTASMRAMATSVTAYYQGVDPTLTGDGLKAVLHDLIDDHRSFSYAALWDLMGETDEAPTEPGRVTLLYSPWTLDKDDHGGGSSQWTREHVWAKSRGDFGTSKGAGTDLHHIRPSDKTVNSTRNNRAFDDGGELYVDGDGETGSRKGTGWTWEPRDEVKGDVARMIFYMAVRYEGDDPGDPNDDGEPDLELTDEILDKSDKSPFHGRLSTLLRWHAQDPPSQAERRRNDLIEQHQGNRNPFIDHPEWVDRIWQ